MKKIFILTGESSGDKLAAKVISNLKKINPNIDYLSVGGENLKSLGIKSIYDLKEITYLGFTEKFIFSSEPFTVASASSEPIVISLSGILIS